MRDRTEARQPLTIDQLIGLVTLCDELGPDAPTYKFAYILAYFAMLRRSNIAPNWPQQFDATRHPVRGDIQITPLGLAIRLRWAKNMQSPTEQVIYLPVIHGHILDPMPIFCQMLAVSPTTALEQPLLTLQSGRPLAATNLHDFLKKAIAHMGYDPSNYGMHSLRIGSATFMKSRGCTQLQIQRHGLWKSDAVNLYLRETLQDKLTVPLAFAAALAPPLPPTMQSPCDSNY